MDRLVSCYLFLHFSPEAPHVSSYTHFFYTMATTSLNGLLEKAPPKHMVTPPCLLTMKAPTPMPMIHHTFSQSSITSGCYNTRSSSNFYLVHGHANVTRGNAENSLVEWASYQRSKIMGAVGKYDPKWKHSLN
jgi:hypothetical protein